MIAYKMKKVNKKNNIKNFQIDRGETVYDRDSNDGTDASWTSDKDKEESARTRYTTRKYAEIKYYCRCSWR